MIQPQLSDLAINAFETVRIPMVNACPNRELSPRATGSTQRRILRRQIIRSITLIGILFLVVFAGCDPAGVMNKMTPQQDESVARNYIDQLRQNKFDQIEKDMDSSISDSDIPGALVKMAAMFPAQDPVSVKVVGVNIFRVPNSSTTDITLEYEFPQKWLLARVVTQKRDGIATITGFHVNPIRDSLENLNKFTLLGKGVAQYTVLLLAVLSSLLSLYAFVVCIRTERGKRRWLWLILVLVGVCKLGVNWTTGQSSFVPLVVWLPPAGAAAPPYGAWTVYVSIPLGALAFLILREMAIVDQINNPD